MDSGVPCSSPLLPNHPPLTRREPAGPRTIFVSPRCPKGMQRATWCLDDYAQQKQLYRGKASKLDLAVCRLSGTSVALKSYAKRRLSNLNWYQVERELRLHGTMEHESIIQLHAAFEDDEAVYMVQEYAGGGDLYEDLKRGGGQMGEAAVAGGVLAPFLSAMAYLHARRIIHRDIKPENILLTADRKLKLADFGLSIDWSEERPVTRAGTLDYMSPEVLVCPEKSRPEENKARALARAQQEGGGTRAGQGWEKVLLGYTDACDVWAAGVLAYELLVGKPPFEQESREETYQYIRHRDPVLPSWMSDGAKDFITSALAKSARKRPTMQELLQHPWIVGKGRAAPRPAITLQATAGPAVATPRAPSPAAQSPQPAVASSAAQILPRPAGQLAKPAVSVGSMPGTPKVQPPLPTDRTPAAASCAGSSPTSRPGTQHTATAAAAAAGEVTGAGLPTLGAAPSTASVVGSPALPRGSSTYYSATSVVSRGPTSFTSTGSLLSTTQSPLGSFTLANQQHAAFLETLGTSSSPRSGPGLPERSAGGGSFSLPAGLLPRADSLPPLQQQALPRTSSLHTVRSQAQLPSTPQPTADDREQQQQQQSPVSMALDAIQEQPSSMLSLGEGLHGTAAAQEVAAAAKQDVDGSRMLGGLLPAGKRAPRQSSAEASKQPDAIPACYQPPPDAAGGVAAGTQPAALQKAMSSAATDIAPQPRPASSPGSDGGGSKGLAKSATLLLSKLKALGRGAEEPDGHQAAAEAADGQAQVEPSVGSGSRAVRFSRAAADPGRQTFGWSRAPAATLAALVGRPRVLNFSSVAPRVDTGLRRRRGGGTLPSSSGRPVTTTPSKPAPPSPRPRVQRSAKSWSTTTGPSVGALEPLRRKPPGSALDAYRAGQPKIATTTLRLDADANVREG
eukprot:scaffold20.g7737.t1